MPFFAEQYPTGSSEYFNVFVIFFGTGELFDNLFLSDFLPPIHEIKLFMISSPFKIILGIILDDN
jgi:hypothetical protein